MSKDKKKKIVVKDLFGKTVDPFIKAIQKYGIWPTTVWDCNKSDRTRRDLIKKIGDMCSCRLGSGSMVGLMSKKGGKVTESIFDPMVCIWILNLFAPKSGLCFDPFAGGGTRAIMAVKAGLKYLGVELRQEEVDATIERCRENGAGTGSKIKQGNSQKCKKLVKSNSADFCYTCPPYYNLETYQGGDDDLSMCGSYDDFLKQMQLTIDETYRILKPGSLSCWVVGLLRDDGKLLCMNHDITRLHQKAGFIIKEEVILSHKNNGSVQRVGNFERGSNLLIRNHEYLLVFEK